MAAAHRHGGASEPLGQFQVAQGPGPVAGRQQRRRIARRAAVQPPDGHPQVVLAPPRPAPFDLLGQPPHQRPPAQQPAARPDHLAVERVGQPDLQPDAVGLHAHQMPLLQPLQRVRRGEPGQQIGAERLAEGQVLQHLALVADQLPDPPGDRLAQRRRHRQRPAPAPHPAHVHQRPGEHQFPYIERVPPARLPEPDGRGLLHPAAERRPEQRGGLLHRERLKVETGQQVVLPERPHGVGRGRLAPHGRDHPGPPEHDQVVDQRGRGGVQQVRVVDHQYRGPDLGGGPSQRVPARRRRGQ